MRSDLPSGAECLIAEEQRWSESLEILEDVVPISRPRRLGHGDPGDRTRAWMHEELGDLDRFWAITEENLDDARAREHKRIEARAVSALAERVAHEGRLGDARSLLSQAVRIDREFGNLPFVAVDLARFAFLLTQEGDPRAGTLMLSQATSLHDEMGFALESWMKKDIDEALALGEAARDA